MKERKDARKKGKAAFKRLMKFVVNNLGDESGSGSKMRYHGTEEPLRILSFKDWGGKSF